MVNIAATFVERAADKRINSQSLEDAGYCFGSTSLGIFPTQSRFFVSEDAPFAYFPPKENILKCSN